MAPVWISCYLCQRKDFLDERNFVECKLHYKAFRGILKATTGKGNEENSTFEFEVRRNKEGKIKAPI